MKLQLEVIYNIYFPAKYSTIIIHIFQLTIFCELSIKKFILFLCRPSELIHHEFIISLILLVLQAKMNAF